MSRSPELDSDVLGCTYHSLIDVTDRYALYLLRISKRSDPDVGSIMMTQVTLTSFSFLLQLWLAPCLYLLRISKRNDPDVGTILTTQITLSSFSFLLQFGSLHVSLQFCNVQMHVSWPAVYHLVPADSVPDHGCAARSAYLSSVVILPLI